MSTQQIHKLSWRIGLLVAVALILPACSGDRHDDLVTFVEKVKARPKGKIKPLPEVKPFETFVYDDTDRRDPFTPFVEDVHIEQDKEVVDTGLRPDMNRKREALEAFSLDSLQYVGTLEKKGTTWALLAAPDNTVYRAQVGNHIGRNYGEILEISETQIKIKEIIPNGATGGWIDRMSSISIRE